MDIIGIDENSFEEFFSKIRNSVFDYSPDEQMTIIARSILFEYGEFITRVGESVPIMPLPTSISAWTKIIEKAEKEIKYVE